jgi:coenzyme F420-reducing hydrogenase gamma subunit
LALSHIPNEAEGKEIEAVFGGHFHSHQLNKSKVKLAVGKCAIERMQKIGLSGHEIPGCPPSIDNILREFMALDFKHSDEHTPLSASLHEFQSGAPPVAK